MTLLSVLLLVRKGSHQAEVSPRNILWLQSQSPGSGGSSPSAAPHQFLPSHLCPALPCALPGPSPRNKGRHAIEVGDWLICTRMDWTLFRIFFWCPAKVTPILRRSLQGRQTEEGQRAAEGGEPALLLLKEVREVSSAGISTEPKHGPMSITGSESRDTPAH